MGRVTSYGTKGTELVATITDSRYRPDGTKRGVVFCHGLNGVAWNPVNYPDPVIDELARRGHPVASPDLGGPATWGNDAAQAKITDAKDYLQASMGAKAGGVLLWCGSMGTLAGLNYLRLNPTLVAGVAVGLPAVDLADLHDNAAARGITVASVESAYVDAAGYTAARAAHNPSENMAAYAPLAARVKLWYSTDDQTTIPSRVTAFASATGVPAVSLGATGGHVFPASAAGAVADFLTSFN